MLLLQETHLKLAEKIISPEYICDKNPTGQITVEMIAYVEREFKHTWATLNNVDSDNV